MHLTLTQDAAPQQQGEAEQPKPMSKSQQKKLAKRQRCWPAEGSSTSTGWRSGRLLRAGVLPSVAPNTAAAQLSLNDCSLPRRLEEQKRLRKEQSKQARQAKAEQRRAEVGRSWPTAQLPGVASWRGTSHVVQRCLPVLPQVTGPRPPCAKQQCTGTRVLACSSLASPSQAAHRRVLGAPGHAGSGADGNDE